MINVLFICLGNICRSPTAQVIFQDYVKKAGYEADFRIESAATDDYHVGEAPDKRAQAQAEKEGLDMSHFIVREITPKDFEEFDYIVSVDRHNYDRLMARCPLMYQHKISLLLSHVPNHHLEDVPDPYYGNETHFEAVFHLIAEGARGLLKTIEEVRS